MILASLLAVSCNTEDANPYDIPARPVIAGASLEFEPDGSPLILAQVGMNYASSAPVSEWESPFQTRNVESIAYTPGTGGWNSHSFRNLQSAQGESRLLRNSKGEIEALIENFHRLILYARKGTGWEVRNSHLQEAGKYGYGYESWGPGQLALVGDSAWEAKDASYAGNFTYLKLGIKRNNGTGFFLDSVSGIYRSLMITGKETNYLILPFNPPYDGSTPYEKVACYRWSLDPANPNPRKQVLALENTVSYGNFFSSQVLGETRAYYRVGRDSLAEFAIRSDTLALLGYRLFHAFPVDTPTTSPYTNTFHMEGLGVDPAGCLHYIDIHTGGIAPSPDTIPILAHSSSCEAAIDTVPLPQPIPGGFEPMTFDVRFAPDGSLALALALVRRRIQEDYKPAQSLPPSWLYLARRDLGKK